MKAEEELAALRTARENQRARERQVKAASASVNGAAPSERSVSLAAVCWAAAVPGLRKELLLPRQPDSSGRDALRDRKTSAELAAAGRRQDTASSGAADAGAAEQADEASRGLPDSLQEARNDADVEAVVGSLDMHAVRALSGEVLIGEQQALCTPICHGMQLSHTKRDNASGSAPPEKEGQRLHAGSAGMHALRLACTSLKT